MTNLLVKNILKTLEKNGFEAYLVGGAVRDYLLNRKTNDFDIATNALPSDLVKIFGSPLKQIEYGSYNLQQKGLNIDITTYRVEHNYNNRHPKISYSQNLLIDAKRRDFTINAIYLSKNNSKIDPYNGIEDIKKKKIVCIGNPLEKLVEDPLRILRTIRFASVLNFKIDEDLSKAIFLKKEEVLTLSKERIKKELDAIFLANGFALLKHYELDKLLDLNFDNLVYVSDLAGLWAQVKTSTNYPLEKEVKNNIKIITNIINCGTINAYDIYENGLYLIYVCSSILKISKKEIDNMYHKMPIKSSKDLKINGKMVHQITNCEEKEIKNILKEVTELILNNKLKNNRKQIIKYLERRKFYANTRDLK